MMSRQMTSKVRLLGPTLLTALVAFSLNSYSVAANDDVTIASTSPAITAVSDSTTAETATSSAISPEPQASTTSSESNQPNFALAELYAKTEAETLSVESNAIINVQPVWEENIKGQGMVVAVIDSGLDVEHNALTLSDISTAKFKSEEEMEAKKAEAGINYGQWYNDKVVFGYNYTDSNTELKESDVRSHGMHVSGISVGNPTQTDSSGTRIVGVAPEAQLMFMRVFSDTRGGGTAPFLYARAIEDAVKLGADSINLSLGSPNGSLIDVGDHITRAIDDARKKGVTVVIAAGNDTVFGDGKSLPYADNPDYAVVATPATARDGIAVASYNNTHLTREVATILGMEDNAELNFGKVNFTKGSNSKKEFAENVAYDYLYVGLGKTEDFEGQDLTGRIALIKRGEISFADKVANAKKAGAIGAVVFNNVTQTLDFTMNIPGPETALYPSIFIPIQFGEELAKESGTGKYKFQFNKAYETVVNPEAGKMSDFTSWGLSADGELKPDVSAPGGAIYSAINNNGYASMDGTSMASPHIAGVIVLMKQALQKKYPDLSPEDLQIRIKQLLMSTALPHFNTDTQAYTSPRQQGAGIADTHKAIHSDLYLTGDDDLTSIVLGNVDDSFTFNVRLYNTSNSDKTLNYITHLNTDEIVDGRVTLKPRELNQTTGTVTVAANSSVLIPITVDSSAFTEELSKLMVNGYFLEGFVRFVNPVDGGDEVSIPFVGFKGAFENLAVIEKPIGEFDFNNGDLPFYYPERKEGSKIDELNFTESEEYTTLLTSESEWDHNKGIYTPETPIIAGTYLDSDGKYILYRDETGKPYYIISPNGDNNRDAVMLRAVMLRNFTDVTAAVYRDEDIDRTNPVWVSENSLAGTKNYYGGKPANSKSTILDNTLWAGKDNNGKVLPDGKYVYVVTYRPTVPGAKSQEISFNILIDTSRPAITTASIYDEDARTFKPRPGIAWGATEIYRETLYYNVNAEDYKEVLKNGREVTRSNTVRIYIKPDENGVYTLPTHDINGKELRITDFWYRIENRAGNSWSAVLPEIVQGGTESGLVRLGISNPETQQLIEADFRYIIRDSEGNDVTAETTSVNPAEPFHSLPFGDYTVELILHDEDEAYLIDERIKSFTVDEEHSLVGVYFKATPLSRTSFAVDFDTIPPVGTKVYLVDSKGKRTELPQGRYTKDIFEKKIVSGDYTISIELPAGYQAVDLSSGEPIVIENLTYTIAGDKLTVKNLSLQAKGNLENGGAAETADDLPAFDPNADLDNDGFSNQEELTLGTDPADATSYPQTAKGDQENGGAAETADDLPAFDLNADHDGDGFTTAEEMAAGTDPFHAGTYPQTSTGDNANNGYPNLNDDKPVFDLEADYDGDGFTNRQELDANTNPLDKNSFPVKNEEPATPPTNQDENKETPDNQKDKDKETSDVQGGKDTSTPDHPKDKLADQLVNTDRQVFVNPAAPAPRPAATSNLATYAAATSHKASLPETGDQTSVLTLIGASMTALAAYYLTRRKKN
ncbi:MULTISPECIES: S8 family serine peptidase [unclassified Streptococcus]|uniref:S8 family serine peptidase n=1 Tax=unclassified Streptococcus TaxID=2608887 RepID=UPI00359D71AE